MMPVFTKNLIDWNTGQNTRSMPWKGEKDPYRIWLSEIILQQTRVEQGLAYYNRFITRYPTVHQLAAAPEQEVFKLWEGLGYYSRCKNLIATARFISKTRGGNFPDTYEGIGALNGVGPYTAAAIASFAFNLPHAVVDGNVTRVLARYFGISTPINSTAGKKQFARLADTLLSRNEPAVFNQAIMDFGAVICKPKQPLCSICIQQSGCEAFLLGAVADLPVKDKGLPKKKRFFNYYYIENKECVYIRKRTGKDIWENLYEFVLHEHDGVVATTDEIIQMHVNALVGTALADIIEISETFTQQLTHQTIEGRFITIRLHDCLPSQQEYQQVLKTDLVHYPFPRFIASWLAQKAAC